MGKKGHGRVVGALIVLAVVSGAIASVTRLDGTSDACAPGTSAVATVGGVTLCSHGPDSGVGLIDPDADGGTEAASTRAIACIGNGSSGARVQAIYARAAGRSDRYAVLLPQIRAAAADVEHLVNRSAAQTGGERHVRWQTTTRAVDPTCLLDVARATVPADAATDFGGLVDHLAEQGFDRHDRKYLVWLDTAATTCSGIATHLDDDRPGQENFNNTSVGYARVDDSCLGHNGVAETHELLHLFGAVQSSAPHASPQGHCSDEWDLLCYDDDGSGGFRPAVRCPARSLDRRLDCNDDDYFSTNPVRGSYLDRHWNAADSRFLDDEPPVVVPPPSDDPPRNDSFASAPVLSGYAGNTPSTLAGATLEQGEPIHGSGVTGSIWYKWRPQASGPVSVDTRGTVGDTVLAVYTGVEVGSLRRVGVNDDAVDLAPQSRVSFTAVAGTTYRIAVSGRGDTAAVTLRWGPPPHGFTDVAPGARAENAVGWSTAYGVMPGWPDRTWRPRLSVTRGQAVAILWRALGSRAEAEPERQPETGTALPFRDVGPTASYRDALGWAVAQGAVPASVTFRPTDPLTRSDLATWTWAVAGRPTATDVAAFTDLSGSSSRAAALWATEHGLVTGHGDGTFRPAGTISRSKLAVGLFALAQDPSAWAALDEPPRTALF